MTSARVVIVLALALASLSTLPASAQDDTSITLTLRLTIQGEAPEGERFSFSFEYPHGYAPGGSPYPSHFCGYADNERAEIELGQELGGDAPCEGGGATYVVERVMPKGATIYYHFNRGRTSESFTPGKVVLHKDTTIGAVYTFPSPDNDSRGIPASMPETGAGGPTGTGLPARHFPPIALLLAASYGWYRRRHSRNHR